MRSDVKRALDNSSSALLLQALQDIELERAQGGYLYDAFGRCVYVMRASIIAELALREVEGDELRG